MTIRSELTKGVFWIAVAKYSGIIISLFITAILARNVSPAAFGTMAIATVVMAFLDIFSDMGLGVAVIQFRDLTKRQIHSLFTISVLLALGLAFFLYFSADVIARFYNDQILQTVIRWLCICLFFKALNIIPNGMMLRNKKFKAIAIRTLTFQVIGGLAACWMALSGWGIYSLLVNPILSSVGVFGYNFYNFPQRPVWPIDMLVVKKVWSYSMYQFLFGIINYFSRNIDTIIIGKYFSMKELGYYEKSYRLMQLPLQNVTYVITPVLHPILSSLQNNKEELSSKNIRLTEILSQIGFPLGIILYFCASPIIMIIFGKNWISSIPVFQILTISVPLQIINSTSGSFFQAGGFTKHLFYCGVFGALVVVGSFVLAAIIFRSINSMAWAWVISLTISYIFNYWLMNKLTFRSSVLKYFSSLIPQIINSVITIGIVYLAIKVWTPINPILQITWVLIATAFPTLIMGSILHQYSVKRIGNTLLSKITPKK